MSPANAFADFKLSTLVHGSFKIHGRHFRYIRTDIALSWINSTPACNAEFCGLPMCLPGTNTLPLVAAEIVQCPHCRFRYQLLESH
jgi:hypothetical protein